MGRQRNIRVALVSPLKSAYSETFIRAQKELLPFNIFYYHSGHKPQILEGFGSIIKGGMIQKNKYRIKNKIGSTSLNYTDYLISNSFRKNKIEVVLAQYGPTGDAIWPICKALNIPLIVHFHGYDTGMPEIIKKHNSYCNLFSYAHKIICVSRAMEDKLLNLGCPKEKLVYNVYGPNDAFLQVIPKYTNQNFIGVGRFTDKKAPYYTILAFSKVLEKNSEARLIIGGDGPLYNMCKNLIKYLKIGYAVELPGKISPAEYRDYLEKSIAFVQHSIIAENGDCEGTPVSVLEASAAGLPVISTKHAGIPDVIIDGETGLLLDEHDVEGMSNAMIKILENKDFVIKLGNSGKERIRNNFSMDRYIKNLTKIIEKTI